MTCVIISVNSSGGQRWSRSVHILSICGSQSTRCLVATSTTDAPSPSFTSVSPEFQLSDFRPPSWLSTILRAVTRVIQLPDKERASDPLHTRLLREKYGLVVFGTPCVRKASWLLLPMAVTYFRDIFRVWFICNTPHKASCLLTVVYFSLLIIWFR